jgi:hypothetical protein
MPESQGAVYEGTIVPCSEDTDGGGQRDDFYGNQMQVRIRSHISMFCPAGSHDRLGSQPPIDDR